MTETSASTSRGAGRSIPLGIRRAVVARDGMNCRTCGQPVVYPEPGEGYRPDHLHLDHVVPWASGGEHSPTNLIVSCAGCNLRRSKPAVIARHARIGVEPRGTLYYWTRPDFAPPKKLRRRADGYELDHFCELFAPITVGGALGWIMAGTLSASGGRSPILVGVPRYLWPKSPRT